MDDYKKILYIIWFLVLVIMVGTFGFMIIEGFSLLDALYMSVITISTVGFREVRDLSPAGQVFTIFLILAGLGTAAYALTSITSFVVEGEFKYLVRRRRMERKISELENHYIVCGAGKTGQHIVARMQRKGVLFVVIENDKDKVEELKERDILVIDGDASQEDVLRKAQINKAKGLISSLSTDAENVFTVLTARQLNTDLYIVARAIEENASVKLRKAGADNTVSPNEIGGNRMASLILRPAVVSFLDIITRVGDITWDMEEVMVHKDSKLIGKALADANIPEKTGLVVMAIKQKDSDYLTLNPGPDYVLREGDKMVVLGQIKKINTLREIACDPNLPVT